MRIAKRSADIAKVVAAEKGYDVVSGWRKDRRDASGAGDCLALAIV